MRRMAFNHRLPLALSALTLFSPALWASIEPDLAAQQLRSLELQPGKAVLVRKFDISAGLANIFIEEGTLYPTSPVAGQVVEMVFLGRGRFRLEPPDAIEADQLELFTGNTRLDEPFDEADTSPDDPLD